LAREVDALAVQGLKRMAKSGPVDLAEDVFAYLDDVVRPYSDDVAVEGPVVDRAHCDSIRDDWLASLGILLDMSGVKKLRMA